MYPVPGTRHVFLHALRRRLRKDVRQEDHESTAMLARVAGTALYLHVAFRSHPLSQLSQQPQAVVCDRHFVSDSFSFRGPTKINDTRNIPGVPYTTVYVVCISHPSGSVFQVRIARQPRGCRRRSSQRDVSNAGLFLATVLFQLTVRFQLWRYQPWKIGPGVCDE